jgi:hypothetical protein
MRQALLVLGMHRSGTSALAGTLVRLGAAAPKTLMGAHESNPRGHWESVAFCRFNDKLLQAAGSAWDDPGPIDARFFATVGKRFGAEFRKLLRQEFGRASLLCIKDPRMCRLLPFWLPQLTACGVEPLPVLALRHPLEVAASLKARNGFPVDRSLALWLRYNLEAEFHTRSLPRALVTYEELLRDWRTQTRRIGRRFAVRWPARAAAEQVDAFLTPQLRHQSSGKWPRDTETVRLAKRAMSALKDLRASRRRAYYGVLDEASAQLAKGGTGARR